MISYEDNFYHIPLERVNRIFLVNGRLYLSNDFFGFRDFFCDFFFFFVLLPGLCPKIFMHETMLHISYSFPLYSYTLVY